MDAVVSDVAWLLVLADLSGDNGFADVKSECSFSIFVKGCSFSDDGFADVKTEGSSSIFVKGCSFSDLLGLPDISLEEFVSVDDIPVTSDVCLASANFLLGSLLLNDLSEPANDCFVDVKFGSSFSLFLISESGSSLVSCLTFKSCSSRFLFSI